MIHLPHLFSRKPSAQAADLSPATHSSASGEAKEACVDVYLLPRDTQEMHRLDFQHYLLRQVLKGNVMAPIGPAPRAILDVGCGTGRWAQEIAHVYPRSEVVGFDLVADQQIVLPGAHSLYRFQQGNLLEGLPFPDQSFDFTHQRLLVAAIPAVKWPFVLEELVRVTCPGGWIELLEASDLYVHPGPLTMQFVGWWATVSQQRGFQTALVRHLGAGLRHRKLHQVSTRTIELPVGAWGGREGQLLERNMLTGFAGLKPFFCSALSLTEETFDQVLQGLSKEWQSYHTRYQFFLAYGQR